MRDVISADSRPVPACGRRPPNRAGRASSVRFEKAVLTDKIAAVIFQIKGVITMKRPNLYHGAAYTTLALLSAPAVNAQQSSEEPTEIVVTGIRASQKQAI